MDDVADVGLDAEARVPTTDGAHAVDQRRLVEQHQEGDGAAVALADAPLGATGQHRNASTAQLLRQELAQLVQFFQSVASARDLQACVLFRGV